MPLGNPIRKQNESRIVSVLATEGQTVFTVQGGYIINQISVFRNGVRLSNSEDFTAGDGSTVTLNNAANIEDRIEFHVFDRFTVQNAIIGAASTQTINGDLVLNGKLFGQLDVPSINLTGIITTTNLNVTGVSTFSDDVEFHGVNGISSITFDKSANNLVFKDDAKAAFGDSSDLIISHDGTLSKIQNSSSGQLEIISNDIDLRSSTGDKNYFTAQVGGAATVFYDNSVRITTSPSGADVTGTLNVTGISTFGGQVNLNGDVNLGDATSDTITVTGKVDSDISPSGSTRDLGTSTLLWRNLYTSNGVIASDDIAVHADDTNTKIRFPSADTIQFETAGSSRLVIDSSGNVQIPADTVKLQIGASQDLYLWHNGSTGNSNISNVTGDLYIQGNNGSGTAVNQIAIKSNAAVELNYQGTKKFETTSSGAEVFGVLQMDDGNSHIKLIDGARIDIGTGNDLQLYHSSNESYIVNNTNQLYVRSNQGIYIQPATNENGVVALPNGNVELYSNNVKRLQTRSGGNSADGIVVYGNSSNSSINLFTDTTIRGTVYANSNNNIGFLDNSGNWAFSVAPAGGNTVSYNHVNPSTSAALDLGTNSARWRNLYIADQTGGNGGIFIGASNDLELYHEGSFNFLVNHNSKNFVIQAKDGENALLTVPDGEVALYHNNHKTCETSSAGFKVLDGTGSNAELRVTATGTNRADVMILATGTGNANLWLDASNGDLSGSDYAFIRHTNADLDVEIGNYANDVIIKTRNGSLGAGSLNTAIHCHQNGAIDFRHDGSLVAQTISNGIQLYTGSSSHLGFLDVHTATWQIYTHSVNLRWYDDVNNDNVMELSQAGNLNIDGSYSNSGVDYAEYFESTDGSAIPVGTTVVLDNGKVRAATSSETPIGVIRPKTSGTSVTGGVNQLNWQGKYLVDDYDAQIMESAVHCTWTDDNGDNQQCWKDRPPTGVTIPSDAEERTMDRPKLNPLFDESKTYVPRSERDEWNCVGLLGQIPITKGQPTSSNWIKMKDRSATVELWMVK